MTAFVTEPEEVGASMMGPSHALSGAAVWLAGSWALSTYVGYEQSPLAVAVGTVVCAGGALFPDLDLSGRVIRNQGGATVARTFGVFSLFIAECIEKLSLFVYHASKLPRDPHRTNGHRTFTHTVPFAALVGWGTTALCAQVGKPAVVGIVFFMVGLALRGLFDGWAERAGWVIVTLASAAAAWFTAAQLPGDRGYPMLGLAAGVGCLTHLLGDMITRAGVPILWPIPLGGRTWRMIGVPDSLAVRVGGTVEVVVLRTAFASISVLAVLALLAPAVMHGVDVFAGGN